MKTNVKKLLSVVLVVALLLTTALSAIVVNASAVVNPGPNLTYTFNESTGVFTVSGTGDMYDFRDTNAGTNHMTPWASIKENIKTVVIEEGVTGIGEYAFYNCVNLTSVSLPSTLKEIRGSGATGGAASSSSLFSYGAFRGCTSLEHITLPDGLKTIGTVAFRDCSALKEISIPDSVTSIGTGAFVHCTALEAVTFGEGITEIPTEGFYECSKLLTINWGTNVTTVNEWAFYGTRLNDIDIPSHITKIDARAFADCFFLLKTKIDNPNCSIANLAYNNTRLSKPQDFTVVGHTGSTAQTFAENRGYTFISMDDCEHTNTKDVVITPATCTETGVSNTVCQDCEFVVSINTIEATGHDYLEVGKEDKTEENAHIITYEKCCNCNEERTTVTHVEAEDSGTVKKYVWVDGCYTSTKLGNCKYGTETYTCTVDGCGTYVGTRFVATTQTFAKSGEHNVDSWTVKKSATCTENGSRTGHCSKCNTDVTEIIPATGHEYDTENPTRTEDKTTTDGHIYKYYACSKCGGEAVETEHKEWLEDYYSVIFSTAAGCVVDGVERQQCIVCGESRNVTLKAPGEHDWQVKEVIEPTCTSKGQTNYECSRCGMTKQGDQVAQLGHDYVVQESSSLAPTCTVEGYNSYKCSRCSSTKQEALAKLGHTPRDGMLVVKTAPTCEKVGKQSYTCDVCETSVVDEEIPAIGHEFENVETEIADKPGHIMSTPTCIHEGCSTTQTGTVVHKEWIDGSYERTVVTEATCTTGEVSRDKCNICGTTRANNEGDPLGHEYKFVRVYNEITTGSDSSNGTLSYLDDGDSGLSGIVSGIGGVTSGINVEPYSVVYICKHCSSPKSITGTSLLEMWKAGDFYNTASEGRVTQTNSSYLDVTGDGFINAKDYALIKNLSAKHAQYKLEHPDSTEETE